MQNKSNKRVLLGMSGGVDSSVAAIELLNQGYEVLGATMLLLNEQQNQSIIDAKVVCEKLNIKHFVFDLRKEFEEFVINNFIENYKNAKTPNPCIQCNKFIKFGEFYKKALELECDYIATGHYAKIEYSEIFNQFVIKKVNSAKDQTYVLYNVKKEIIPHILFPISKFDNKEQIRNIAKENKLSIADKPDSQEICFISDNNYSRFLNQKIGKKSKIGNFVNLKGEILGKHNGLINYTVGQRKGLGLTHETPLYVVKLDIDKNEVIVDEEKEIFSKELYASDINFNVKLELKEPMDVSAKIRYGAKEAKAKLYYINENLIKLEFYEAQRAITKGQSVVLYLQDVLIGGGIII